MNAYAFFETFLKNHPRKYIRNKFSYVTGGTSKTAFLIFPGSGENEYSYYNLIDHFEKKYKVIVINYLNFSSLDEFFEITQKILKKEKIQSVMIYGLSLGGFFAQAYVRKYGMVNTLILSHVGSMKSPTIRMNVIKLLKLMLPFLSLIPTKLFRIVLRKILIHAQLHKQNIDKLYDKYASPLILEKSKEYGKRFRYPLSDKAFIRSIAHLGTDAEKEELSHKKIYNDSKNILILRTDNDPLTQDDGVFEKYYPNASVHTFEETGHLTPYIQIEKMLRVIDEFLENK